MTDAISKVQMCQFQKLWMVAPREDSMVHEASKAQEKAEMRVSPEATMALNARLDAKEVLDRTSPPIRRARGVGASADKQGACTPGKTERAMFLARLRNEIRREKRLLVEAGILEASSSDEE